MRLPVKTLQYNRCPAVAPLGKLEEDVKKRLDIDLKMMLARQKQVDDSGFKQNLLKALEIMDQQLQTRLLENAQTVDGQLYDGFLDDKDKPLVSAIRSALPDNLTDFGSKLHDKRLQALLPLYKARNFPSSLNAEERAVWDAHRQHRLMGGGEDSRLGKYFARLQVLQETPHLTDEQRYLLTELELYGQSMMP